MLLIYNQSNHSTFLFLPKAARQEFSLPSTGLEEREIQRNKYNNNKSWRRKNINYKRITKDINANIIFLYGQKRSIEIIAFPLGLKQGVSGLIYFSKHTSTSSLNVRENLGWF